MASTDARPVPQKNVAYRVTFPILDADGDLVTGASGLDSEVSIDGGTFSDCTNEATEIATNSGVYYLDLTQSEMNGDTIAVIVKTSTSGAKTTVLVFYPEEAGDIRVNVTQFGGSNGTFSGGRPEVNTTHAAGTAWGSGAITAASIAADAITAAKIADGAIDANTFATGAITAAAIAADAIGASELAADAVAEIQSGLATSANQATIIGYIDTEVAAILAAVDTEVAAIKAKTDNLPSDPADQSAVEAAITAAFDVPIPGTPTAGSINDVLKDLDARLPGSGTLSTLSAAAVNAEVVDALAVDTYAEPGQGSPAATATLAAKLNYLYKAWRNKSTQTSSQYSLYADDASTVDHKSACSDDGTTATRGEIATGP